MALSERTDIPATALLAAPFPSPLVEVLTIEGMTVMAFGLSHIGGRYPGSTQDVDPDWYWIEVVWVETESCSTEMIQAHSCRNGADVSFIGHPVYRSRFLASRASRRLCEHDSSISVVSQTYPHPASRLGDDPASFQAKSHVFSVADRFH